MAMGNKLVTTIYDNTLFSCANLDEYISAKVANGISYVMWTDSRHMVTKPISQFEPLSGQTHPQRDIFFEAILVR